MRVLVVEDDREMAASLERGLKREGYAVDVAYDGDQGEYCAESVAYDLIILDIVLPKKDGIEVCSALRQKKIDSRVLMLTCKDSPDDKVRGLDSGADDYLAKPFAFSELCARMRALLRREISQTSPVIEVGNITLNTATREVKLGQTGIDLNTKEYSILHYLMSNPGAVITKRMIEEHVWGSAYESETNLVEVYISRLRNNLGDEVIETVRGAGYRLRAR